MTRTKQRTIEKIREIEIIEIIEIIELLINVNLRI
jgi:hypothetical protein